VSVKWPEGGALTLDWVDALGRALDFASRNLQPADLPTILPVSVCDSLLLVAQKVSEIGKF
jgi:serine/threonine-protein phosphatase 5